MRRIFLGDIDYTEVGPAERIIVTDGDHEVTFTGRGLRVLAQLLQREQRHERAKEDLPR